VGKRLNEEFLNAILANEDISASDKVKQIISEHEADTRGLLQKRDELLGSEKKLKEHISSLENENSEYDSKVKELESALEKATSEDNKQYYENKINELTSKHTAAIKLFEEDRDSYKSKHLNALKEKAIYNATKDLNFIDGLKDGFVARVLAMNTFEEKEIDGEYQFLNKELHTIEEDINSFALSQEGKAYIKNESSGGGALGSTSRTNPVSKNPFKKDTFDLSEQMRLYKENRNLYEKLKSEA
jgi:hypothetical protein